jgi:hypothetical protein
VLVVLVKQLIQLLVMVTTRYFHQLHPPTVDKVLVLFQHQAQILGKMVVLAVALEVLRLVREHQVKATMAVRV